jgi:hypothetical protein
MVAKSIRQILISVMVVGILAQVGNAAEKIDLKLQLKPGEKHSMRITTTENIAMESMGKQENVGHTKKVGIEFEVKEIDTNDIASVKVIYLTLQEKTKIGETEQGYEYDSTKPDTTENPIGRMYSAMIGESFIMKITPKGRIIELKGVDEFFLKMADKMMSREDESIKERLKERAEQSIDRLNQKYGSREKRREALKEQIKNFPGFGKQPIRNILSDMTVVFPSGALQIGDSWKDNIVAGFGSEIEGTYTLKGSEKQVLTINVSGKRSLDDKPAISQVGPIKSTTRLAGSYETTIKVDEKNGWLLGKQANMKFTGETKTAGDKQAPQEQMKKMSIESSIVVEPI